MTGIISAIIAGAVTLIGVLIANSRSQAVTDTKLEELTREVREHNNFARRVPILEEQMKGGQPPHRRFRSQRTRERKELTMNAKTYNAPTISAGTITRTAVLLLALTNQILSACGKPVLPIESATVEQLVTAGITTVAALVAWWKNNSFTVPALKADAMMKETRVYERKGRK